MTVPHFVLSFSQYKVHKPLQRQVFWLITQRVSADTRKFTPCLCRDKEANDFLLSRVWQLRCDRMIVSSLCWKYLPAEFSLGHKCRSGVGWLKITRVCGQCGIMTTHHLFWTEQSFSSVSVQPEKPLKAAALSPLSLKSAAKLKSCHAFWLQLTSQKS